MLNVLLTDRCGLIPVLNFPSAATAWCYGSIAMAAFTIRRNSYGLKSRIVWAKNAILSSIFLFNVADSLSAQTWAAQKFIEIKCMRSLRWG